MRARSNSCQQDRRPTRIGRRKPAMRSAKRQIIVSVKRPVLGTHDSFPVYDADSLTRRRHRKRCFSPNRTESVKISSLLSLAGAPDMEGKTILVTGAARRLGSAIAREMHGTGANIMVHYHQAPQRRRRWLPN
jgi:hypothetical protein